MKQRFSYLDLKLVANELHSLVSCRIQNIYTLDENPRHFLFKFDSNDGKTFLLVEPGARTHITKFQYKTAPPTDFVSRLRKALNNKRVSAVNIVAGDRTLVVSFSEGAYHLMFELFAAGNIILADQNWVALAVFRQHAADADHTRRVGHICHVDLNRTLCVEVPSIDVIEGWLTSNERIGKLLYSKAVGVSAPFLQHCLKAENVDPKAKTADPDALKRALTKAIDWGKALMHNNLNPGYVLRNETGAAIEFDAFKEHFEAMRAQDPSLQIVDYPSYNQTVDAYFGALLGDRQASRIDQLHKLAETRLDAAKSEKDRRVQGLGTLKQINEKCGTLIQMHADIVDAAISAVNNMIQQGVDWGDMKKLVQLEAKKGNNVAQLIENIDPAKGKITLKLRDDDTENDEPAFMSVAVKLNLSSWANARAYFAIRRAATDKQEKTVQQAQKAFKSAEKKILKDLNTNLEKSSTKSKVLHSVRTSYWFEKFFWFLTSNGNLVIGGRDPLQNTLLLRRYFAKNDIYVHCDFNGASVAIVKSKNGEKVPLQDLDQAGIFTVATSVAWEQKSPPKAWYIVREDVPQLNSKGFPMRPEDVFDLTRTSILPSSNEMGFGLLWQVESDQPESVEEPENGDSEEEFPDTNFDSEDEFPDTNFDSEEEEEEEEEEEDPVDSPESETKHLDEFPKETNPDTNEPTDTNEPADTNEPTDTNELNDTDELSEALGKTNLEPKPWEVGKLKNVRGKKAKLKKLKTYQDQDEEDRKEAMERLGTLKGLRRKAAEQQQKEEVRREQQQQQKERQERQMKKEMERIASEKMEATPFPCDLLTMFPEDKRVLAAVPTFGPWPALKRVQYKIKAITGQTKRGRAGNEALKVILRTDKDNSEPTQQQEELVAGVRSEDVQLAISVSRMSLSLPRRVAAKGAKQTKKKGGK